MSASFYCWEPELGLEPSSQDFFAKIKRLHERPLPKPSAAMLRLVDALLKKYPDLTVTEDTIWSAGPLRNEILGQFIHVAIRWSCYAQGALFMIDTAHQLGLHAYDPQDGSFYPASCAASSDRPAVRQDLGATFRDGIECPEMVWIPKGIFRMGSWEPRCPWESPVHEVRVDYDLAVAKYPVTRGEWRGYLSATARTGSIGETGCLDWETGQRMSEASSWENPGFPQTDSHPVVNVTWQEATEYAAWMSQTTGHAYRLLTESEYEYILRAGSQASYPWGEHPEGMHEYTHRRSREGELAGTWPVGRFKPNAFGLYDTVGHVWCWTQDRRSERYFQAPVRACVAWELGDDNRVARGGSWMTHYRKLRCAYRGDGLDDYTGLRLARTP